MLLQIGLKIKKQKTMRVHEEKTNNLKQCTGKYIGWFFFFLNKLHFISPQLHTVEKCFLVMTIKLIWRLIWEPPTNDISLGQKFLFHLQGHTGSWMWHSLISCSWLYSFMCRTSASFTQFCLKYFFSSNRILMTESPQFFLP